MTSKMDFTADEWKVLLDSPLFVGEAVAAAASSGIVGTMKESMAIVDSITRTAQNHLYNQLIQEVASRGTGGEQMDVWLKSIRGLLQQSESIRVAMTGVEACQKVALILRSKGEPQEVDEFKRWLMEIGESVARAANEGGNMLNVGGVNVSPQEIQILSEMSSILGVTHIPGPPDFQNYPHP
jgi:hypothetical protein